MWIFSKLSLLSGANLALLWVRLEPGSLEAPERRSCWTVLDTVTELGHLGTVHWPEGRRAHWRLPMARLQGDGWLCPLPVHEGFVHCVGAEAAGRGFEVRQEQG